MKTAELLSGNSILSLMLTVTVNTVLTFTVLIFSINPLKAEENITSDRPHFLLSADTERIALIFGNKDYHDKPLKNPINDALAMEKVLKQAGFKVTVKNNLTSLEMLAAIYELGVNLKPNSIRLFYYAGHAVQVDGKIYMIPINAVIRSRSDIIMEAVNIEIVLQQMERIPGSANIVILDACRGDPFTNNINNIERGLTFVDAPPRTIIAYSTSQGRDAKDGSGDNSVYTEELVRQLKVPGSRLTDVFKKVRQSVRITSNGHQIPTEFTTLEEPVVLFPVASIRHKQPKIVKQPQIIELTAEQVWIETITGAGFVGIKGGCFNMGCAVGEPDCEDDEFPTHNVCLDSYGFSQTEITNAQFVIYLNRINRLTDVESHFLTADHAFNGRIIKQNGQYGVEMGFEHFPVNYISWHGAVAFAAWLSEQYPVQFDLPTEAQWEYACRDGGKLQVYAGGQIPAQVAWTSENSDGRPHPVAFKASNKLGIFDMSGNVWEWCKDKYGSSSYQEHPRHNPVIDFVGALRDTSAARVIRGGGFRYDPRRSRCSNRGNLYAAVKSEDVGFRLVMKVPVK